METTKRQGFVEGVVAGLDGWGRLMQAFEANLVDNIAATVPWLAPVAPAFMAYWNVKVKFGWPDWMAWVVAGVVEGVGLSAVTTAYQLWNYNETRRNGTAAAPFPLAAATAAYYLAVVITVNVVLDLTANPLALVTAKALLSTLSIVAMVILALRSQQSRRLAEMQKVNEEKREARREGKLLKQELKLAELQAQSRKVAMKDVEDAGDLPKDSLKVSTHPETYGKWNRWPALPDEEKLKVAERVQAARGTSAEWKKSVVASLLPVYGIDERVAYKWIEYAERDYFALFSDQELTELAKEVEA